MQSIIEYYQREVLNCEAAIKRFEKLINTYSFLRLFAILAGGFICYKVFELELIWLTELIFLVVVLAFAYLVKIQSSYEGQKAFYTALKQVNENEISSIENQSNIYSHGAGYVDDGHNYTSDLDIFGKGSLFNLVNRCASQLGNEKLADWFKKPADKTTIEQRQDAIKELAEKIDWTQDFKASVLFAKDTVHTDVQTLFHYFEEAGIEFSTLVKGYIRAAPYLFFAFATAAWFMPMFNIALGVVALINAYLVISNQLKVNRTDLMLSKSGKTLAAYSKAFHKIEKETWHSLLNLSLAEQLSSREGQKFSASLKRLAVLAGRLEYRLNLLVSLFLNAVFAWDVRELIAIEDWKTRNRGLMPKAFEVVASFETLVSLGSLHSNYADWSFPQIAGNGPHTYIAEGLSHPLIPAAQRVSNDYGLENSRQIDIITGSNMAGKSTFLRTLGINAVLAFSGAPVCARSMQISVVNLFTYMRIRDSLNESTSTFKAELNRLQLLFEVIKKENNVFFLVDEMLRGTNSVDKYRGSKAVIETLVSQNAVGVVATHDLQLAELEHKYPGYIRNFYFDIQIVDAEMQFDYKLKKGECKTFNASLLLKQIGIDVEV